MKVMIIAAALVFVTGCATQQSAERNNMQIKSLEEHITVLEMRATKLEDDQVARKAIDVTRFCFTNNMAFSEGAIYQGKICQPKSSLMTYENGRPVRQPLVWADWKYN